MKKALIFGLVIVCLLMQGAAFAADTLKETITKQVKEQKGNIDPVITALLKQGIEPRLLVKSFIELGYEACKVATVALRESADRQMVIFGALDGGATNEQLSLCEGLGYAYDPPASIEPPPTPPSGSNSVPK